MGQNESPVVKHKILRRLQMEQELKNASKKSSPVGRMDFKLFSYETDESSVCKRNNSKYKKLTRGSRILLEDNGGQTPSVNTPVKVKRQNYVGERLSNF